MYLCINTCFGIGFGFIHNVLDLFDLPGTLPDMIPALAKAMRDIREHILKGKLSTLDLLTKIGCLIKSKMQFQYEKLLILIIYYKEVNCSDSSPSMRIPW